MKRNRHIISVDDQRLDSDEYDLDGKADLHEFEASTECYERRSKIRAKWHQGESWIAIGLYLVLVSVAFIVL